MRKFGLVGCGIGGSLSPEIFRAAYPDFQYDLIDTPDFGEAMRIFESGYEAVNVTAPFKMKAFGYADETDEVSRRIGAVNILVHRDGKTVGYNSDYLAVKRMLLNQASQVEGGVLVVGCGGAGKAAAVAAYDCGFRTVVANRSVDKAAEFCRRNPGLECAPLEEIPALIESCGIVIYTLPVSIPCASLISGNDRLVKIEASYTSPSLSGTHYHGGREWLSLQAEDGYRLMV